MNDRMMPILLTMITKEEAFNLLSKKTQYLVKALVIINMVFSAINLVKSMTQAIGNFKVQDSH